MRVPLLCGGFLHYRFPETHFHKRSKWYDDGDHCDTMRYVSLPGASFGTHPLPVVLQLDRWIDARMMFPPTLSVLFRRPSRDEERVFGRC